MRRSICCRRQSPEARRACPRAQRHGEVLGRVSIAGGAAGSLRHGALVRIRLEQPAVLTRGDRFIIRAYSPPMTIGGGVCWTLRRHGPACTDQGRASPSG